MNDQNDANEADFSNGWERVMRKLLTNKFCWFIF